MSRKIGEAILKLINEIWKRGGISEMWNTGVTSPIYKKGEKSDVRNYTGVTLMDTYKIYANILTRN